jgi:outer membrane autotransporter protein
MTGLDAQFGDDWRIGLAGGYTNADLSIDDRASSVQIGTYSLGLYAGRSFGPINVRLGGAYSWSDVDMDRVAAFPGFANALSSSYDAQTAQVFGEVGYGFTWNEIALEPFAGLAYVHLDTDAVNEVGGAAALNVQSASNDIFYSTLGLRIGTSWALGNDVVLMPRLMLAWQHAYGDVDPASTMAFNSTGAAFSVTGAPLARDAALIEVGADWMIGANAKLGLSYQGTWSDSVTDNAVTGSFSWSF